LLPDAGPDALLYSRRAAGRGPGRYQTRSPDIRRFEPFSVGSAVVPDSLLEAALRLPTGARVYCRECDPGLPWWQEALLASLGVAIASAILYGFFRIGPVNRHMRNLRLRTCFLAVQRGWEKEDPSYFAPFVTYALNEQLRRELGNLAADGKVIHHERPRVRKLRVLSGGGRRDSECVARIESTVCHWLADASTGELVGGRKETSRDEALWRFVREPAIDWLAAEINVAAPGPPPSPEAARR
jgi:hypothetical protein